MENDSPKQPTPNERLIQRMRQAHLARQAFGAANAMVDGILADRPNLELRFLAADYALAAEELRQFEQSLKRPEQLQVAR